MDINETINAVKGKAEELMKNEQVKEVVKGVLDKTDLDEKILGKVSELTGMKPQEGTGEKKEQ